MTQDRHSHRITTTWGQRFLLMGMGIALLVVTELVLRLVGAFPVYRIDDPFLGFQGVRPLFVVREFDGQKTFVTNPAKLAYFNAQKFLVHKPPNSLRIFCFGGSTTYGRPYQAPTAFPSWLQMMLDRVEPDRVHEVINAGGISYASYRIERLMREIVNDQPDLFIVYTGHNEFLETINYANLLNQPALVKRLVTMLDRTRLYRLVRSGVTVLREHVLRGGMRLPGEVQADLDRIGGFDLYHRDEQQRRHILEQFRINVGRMIEIAREARVPIVFVKPVCNISDFSPFKSESTAGLPPNVVRRAGQMRQQGVLAMQRSEAASARSALQKSIALDADYALTHYLLGQCLERLGHIDSARAQYQRAIDLDVCPLRAVSGIVEIVTEVTRDRGVPLVDVDSVFAAYCQNGLPGKEIFVDHVHPTVKGHLLIARGILNSLIESGIVRPSIALTDEACEAMYRNRLHQLDSSYFALADLNLGKVLTWARKHAEALGPLQRAARVLANNVEAQQLLANTYHRLGRYQEAKKAYLHVLSLTPRDAQTWDNLCDVEQHLGHFRAAIQAGKKAIMLAPHLTRFYTTLASVYSRNNQPDSALVVYGQALHIDSTDAVLWNNYGQVLSTLDRLDEALQSFRKAVLLNPGYALAYRNLANSLLAKGDYDFALEAYRQAAHLSPFDAEVQNSLGIIYLKKGLLPQAMNAFRQAVAIDSSFAEAYQNLGTALTFSGKPDSGLICFERALALYPQTSIRARVETLMGLGNAAVLLGDVPQAISAWRLCLRLAPENVAVIFNLALGLMREGQLERAITYFKKALALRPNDRRMMQALADALQKANRPEEAKKYYRMLENR